MQTQGFPLQENSPIGKGWYVGCFYFLYYEKSSLRKHLLGNIALISGMAESRLAFRAQGGIFTRVFPAP